MTDARLVAESVFDRNRRRGAEINEAVEHEAARHEPAVKNMQRLRALRLARDAKLNKWYPEVNDLTLTDRPRDACHLHIWREKLANEMIAIKCPHAVTSNASSHGWHVIEMWIFAHRSHGRVQITGKFGIHMLLKQIDHRLWRHNLLIHMWLYSSGRACVRIAGLTPRVRLNLAIACWGSQA